MTAGCQPLVHDLLVCLQVPWQVWSRGDGQITADGVQGAYCGEIRVLSRAEITIDGRRPAPVAAVHHGAGDVTFVAVAYPEGDPAPHPTLRVERRRRVDPAGLRETLTVTSRAAFPLHLEIVMDVAADLASMETVRSGRAATAGAIPVGRGHRLRWTTTDLQVTLTSSAVIDPAGSRLTWVVDLPARGAATVAWRVEAARRAVFVTAPPTGPEWSTPRITSADGRLPALVHRSLDDLAALRATLADHPDDTFLAAGAPWYLTLFGRDALWAARMLLPLGTALAASTLRLLAAHQGRRVDHRSAEAPGKIPHELRPSGIRLTGGGPDDGLVLPPVYYGTVDATPLWVCLLHDAWRWGLPAAEVDRLVPAAERALDWMAGHGDADGDGFLDYVDRTGTGLSHQGWKDSGDAIQWRDGRPAVGPVALCEVQAYAHEAALSGAALLDAFGRPGGDRWRHWAAALAGRFRERFWVADDDGDRPAVALDGAKQPIDSLTSNIGHLLGTGLLTPEETGIVARRLTDPLLFSGFGIRTMARGSAGFSPLGYHTGAVWPHDTAIAVRGLVRAGRTAEAALLVDGLVAAAHGFDDRLPELFSGDAREDLPSPVPFPGACRPQAWSAASALVLLAAVLGLDPDVPGGTLAVGPLIPHLVGSWRVHGLRLGERDLSIVVDADGTVPHVATDAPVRIDARSTGRS